MVQIHKDNLKLTAMSEDGKNRLDKFKAQFGEEASTLTKL